MIPDTWLRFLKAVGSLWVHLISPLRGSVETKDEI